MSAIYLSGQEYISWLLPAAGHRAKTQFERLGQAFFNILYFQYPRIADTIRATEYDPFYYDEVNDLITQEVVRLYDEMVTKEQRSIMRDAFMADISDE